MTKDELFDIEYDNLDYYAMVTRNLYKDIMKNELYKDDSIYIQTRVLLDVIKYTIALEEENRDLKGDIDKLNEELDRRNNNVEI